MSGRRFAGGKFKAKRRIAERNGGFQASAGATAGLRGEA